MVSNRKQCDKTIVHALQAINSFHIIGATSRLPGGASPVSLSADRGPEIRQFSWLMVKDRTASTPCGFAIHAANIFSGFHPMTY